jgi:hypothetical protein
VGRQFVIIAAASAGLALDPQGIHLKVTNLGLILDSTETGTICPANRRRPDKLSQMGTLSREELRKINNLANRPAVCHLQRVSHEVRRFP